MPRLPDGAYAPAHFGVGGVGDRSAPLLDMLYANDGMRTGYIVAVHYPKDRGFESAIEVTYDVVAPVSNGMGVKNWQEYTNVKMAVGVGGTIEEYEILRPRVPRGWKTGSQITEDILKECSRVRFFCANGRATEAYIVGFLRHDNEVQDDKALGHYWLRKFNGVNTSINMDGEYSVEFTGAILDANTNFHIEPPAETTGTYFKFLKDGSWKVDDVKGESITLDKTNKKITVLARAMDTTTSEGDYNVTAKGKAVFKSDSNAVLNGKKNFIGSENATEPLVKGFELTDALKKLVDAFLNNPLVGRAGSIPVFLEPSLRAQLTAWSNVFGRHGSPFLSRKGFVE